MSLPQADVTDSAALTVELAPAQADAERRFGAGPPPLWQPTSSRDATTRTRPRTIVWAVGALALMTLAAVVFWHSTTTPVSPLAADAQSSADPVPVDEPDERVLDREQASLPAPRPATSAFTVIRDGVGWRIDAAGADRLGAAQRLVQLGAGTLHGDLGLLMRSGKLDLRWQGSRLADAWPAVLGGEASYALQCGRTRCAVWLIATGAPAAFARDEFDATQALPAAVPLRAPAAAWAQAPVQVPVVTATGSGPTVSASPSDSADPRVAAHHD